MCRSSVAARYCVRAVKCVRMCVCLYVPAAAVVSVCGRAARVSLFCLLIHYVYLKESKIIR